MGRPRPTSFGGDLRCCPIAGYLQLCPSAIPPGRVSFYVDTLGLTPVVESEDVLAFRCADGTDFGVFVSQGRASGTHSHVSFFCQNVDAEVADLRARGVQLEEFDMPGATVTDGVYDMNGQRGAWFRDPGRLPLLIGSPSTPIRSTQPAPP